jgi:hypothetical protein
MPDFFDVMPESGYDTGYVPKAETNRDDPPELPGQAFFIFHHTQPLQRRTDMTLVLSERSQRLIVEQAEEEAQRSKAKARRFGLWTLGLAAASAAIILLAPATALAGVAAMLTGTVAIITGSIGAAHFSNQKSMEGVKSKVKEESFVEKLKARTMRLKKMHMRADKISTIGLFSVIGCFALAALFPPIAPVALAVKSLANLAWGGGALISMCTRDSSRSAEKLNATAQSLAPHDSLAAVLAPSGASSGFSRGLAPSFDRAANGNEPEAEAPARRKGLAPKP